MSNFYDELKQRESSGISDPKKAQVKINDIGYMGFYQMGEAALIDAGYYKADGTKTNDWKGQWTGKNGIYSKQDFLNNAAVQETAVREYHEKLWGYIQVKLKDEKNNKDVNSYLGTTINGDVITKEALIGGAHLVGAGGLVSYITSNGKVVPGDGNNVKVSSYIKLLKNTTISSDSFNNNAPVPANISSVFLNTTTQEIFDFGKNIFDFKSNGLINDTYYTNISKIVSSYLINSDPTSNYSNLVNSGYFDNSILNPIKIGAFYESTTNTQDNSTSISNKTFKLLTQLSHIDSTKFMN